jgi:hypothetical protein
MSFLLAAAIVLLVLVIGVALLQRRQTRDFSTRPGGATAAPGTSTPIAAADPERDPDWPFKDDPVLGSLIFDQEDVWSGEVVIGDLDVEVVLRAGREGPGDHHRQWVQAAQGRGDRLLNEARAALAEALAQRAITLEDLSSVEMHLGPDADGVFEGRLVFDPDHDDLDAAYVRSTDTWRTVEARVEMIGGEG